MPASRVFISYSHDSDQHRKRVLALANQIREDGIEAWIDQYVHDPEEGWPMWMRNQVSEADRVLLVFTETYARRFLGKEMQGIGLGVTFETVVATQALYQTGPRNAKFRPVVFTEEDEQFIPLELRRFNRYRVDTPEHYQNLLRWLHEAPRIVAPPVGQKPHLPLEPVPEMFPSKPDEHRDHTAQPPPDGTRTPEADKRALEQAKVQRESAPQAERAPGFMERRVAEHIVSEKTACEQTAPRRVEVKKLPSKKRESSLGTQRTSSPKRPVLLRSIFIVACIVIIPILAILFLNAANRVKVGDNVFLRSREGNYVVSAEIAKYNWPRLGKIGQVTLQLLGDGPLHHGSVVQIQSLEKNLSGNNVLGAFTDSHDCYYWKRGYDEKKQGWVIAKLDASDPVLHYGDKIYLVNVYYSNNKRLTQDQGSGDYLTIEEEADWWWMLEKKWF
jgi:hypothetical protein